MKLFLRNNFFLLIGITFSAISFGQASKEVNPNGGKGEIKSIEVTPKTNSENTTKSTASQSDWHSENSVDGAVTISKKKNEPQVIHNKEYFLNEIIRINNHIEAINTKIESVNSDKKLKSEAKKSDWFDDMERIKNELEIEKLNIQNKLINIEGK